MQLAEADFETTQLAMRDPSNDRVYIEFYYKVREAKAESIEAGRPIFHEVPYIKIMAPGDKDNIVDRPVRDKDMQRFSKQWEAFGNSEAQQLEGTPLVEWPGVSRSEVEELKYFGIHTLEHLAGVNDTHMGKFLGLRALKTKAQDYLKAAENSAPIVRLRAENTQLRNEIDALRAQFEAFAGEKAKAFTPQSTDALLE